LKVTNKLQNLLREPGVIPREGVESLFNIKLPANELDVAGDPERGS